MKKDVFALTVVCSLLVGLMIGDYVKGPLTRYSTRTTWTYTVETFTERTTISTTHTVRVTITSITRTYTHTEMDRPTYEKWSLNITRNG